MPDPRALFLALALLLPAASAGAAPADDLVQAVRTMTLWVAEKTGLPAPAPPAVERTSQAALRIKCFPRLRPRDAPPLWGAYDARRRIIFMDDGCRPGRLVDASYLLHEVVHHVQMRNGLDKTARCRAELEGQAVRLQVQWLREQGAADPLALLGTDVRTVTKLGMCRE